MNLKANRLRAIKGLIQSEMVRLRSYNKTVACILFGYLAVTVIIDIILSSVDVIGSNNGGMLMVGLGTVVIVMICMAIARSTTKERRIVFSFPMDRVTLTLGNFIVFLMDTAVLLFITAIAYLIEVWALFLLSKLLSNFIYINNVSLVSFLSGYLVSLGYILFITTLVYLVSMIFARYKAIGIIATSLVIGLPFISAFGRRALYQILMFYVGEQSILLLSVKLFLSAVLLQILSYLPLRTMEVIE